MSAETDFAAIMDTLIEARNSTGLLKYAIAHEALERLAAQHAEAKRALSTIAGMGGPIGVFAGNELAKLNTP